MSTLRQPSDRVQFIDTDGMPLEDVDHPSMTDDTMLELYRDMYLARRFDRRTVKLNRTGEIGSFPPLYGHEAAQVASAHALEPEDWVIPSYRDHAALHVHGLDLGTSCSTTRESSKETPFPTTSTCSRSTARSAHNHHTLSASRGLIHW